jgi:hypothetical protein
MPFAIFVLAAAAAAHAAPTHKATKVDPAQARAEGYAEAQRALAGEGDFTPGALAANLAAGQRAPAPVPSAPAAPATAQSTGAGQLNLTCLGGGTAKKAAVVTGSSNGYVSGMVGGTLVSGTVSGNSTAVVPRNEQFSDQVDIQLFNGNDRIRLPRTTIPTFHGGDGGWFRLKNVVADARSIHAEAQVNFLNHPKVYIDRVTGTISIAGKDGDYSGECQVIDASAAPKF